MSSILPFKLPFEKNNQSQNKQQQLEEEQRSFKLADPHVITTVVEIAVLLICAILNWQFFISASSGLFGYVIAFLAIICEIFAFICWQSIPRSAGNFRAALITIAVILTGTAITHASIEFWKNTDVIRGVNKQIQFYADYLALGALLLELTVASFTLRLTHWRTQITMERAKSEETIATMKARMTTERAKMEAENELDQERVNHVKKQIEIQDQFVDRIEELIQVHKRAEDKISQLTDQKLKDQIRRAFGEVAALETVDTQSAPPKP